MKKLLLVAVLMLMPVVCYAAPMGFVDEVFIDQSVATENTITSAVFPVKSSGYFGCWIQAKANNGNATTVPLGKTNLNVWCETSYDTNTDNFGKPYGMGNLLSNFESSTPTTVSVNPPPMAYMRFRIDGVKGNLWTGNTTGTTVTMYLFRQE